MIPFQPSAAFQAFFNQVIAAAEAPVTAGSFVLAIPDFSDPHEQAFAHTKLAALIATIDTMKKSLVVATVNPYQVDASGQPLYPEMWGTGVGAP